MTDKTSEKIKDTECVKMPVIDLPPGWSCAKAEGPGPFVTRATFKSPEGDYVSWNSRHRRKHHFRLDKSRGSTWWAPGAIGWWIGILFAIGSTCFALGATPGYVNYVGNFFDGFTFFVGSLFFTAAAILQYLESTNTPNNPPGVKVIEEIRFLILEPKRIDWWSTVVQFVGTLFFNISTFEAMRSNLLVSQIDHLVWAPDAYGSICFLIASSLVWMEVGHSLWSWEVQSLSWWIALLNLLGSAAFGVSALAAYVLPTTGQPLNTMWVNLGTFIGGVCFLIGAVLMLPERTKENKT